MASGVPGTVYNVASGIARPAGDRGSTRRSCPGACSHRTGPVKVPSKRRPVLVGNARRLKVTGCAAADRSSARSTICWISGGKQAPLEGEHKTKLHSGAMAPLLFDPGKPKRHDPRHCRSNPRWRRCGRAHRGDAACRCRALSGGPLPFRAESCKRDAVRVDAEPVRGARTRYYCYARRYHTQFELGAVTSSRRSSS